MRFRSRAELESLSAASAKAVYCGGHTALCRCLGMFNLYVDTSDISITPHLMMNGYWESWVTLAIGRHVKPGMRCVDVGANCGYFAMLMASLGGKVTAFEPQPEMFALLTKSAPVNGLDVKSHASACSNVRGDALLRVEAHCKGGACVVEHNGGIDSTPGTIVVPAQPLDDVCDVADFIKIDAEGHEPHIWDGMARILSECSPVVCLEFFSAFYMDEGQALLDKIRASGYVIRQVNTDGSIGAPVNSQKLGPDSHMLWLTR